MKLVVALFEHCRAFYFWNK